MLLALISLAAAAEEEPSKTPFYILGGLLVVWAVAVSTVGILRHDTFPPTRAAARGVIAISVLLILGAMASAVLTA
ncbi:MAG: hypothetical protein M3O90_05200 [Actinomycetota bacterium]|nr:hypothetical protein [Actinomycetota bacterium]